MNIDDVIKQLELDAVAADEEQELFTAFVQRIAELLDGNPESLFSMMYRLDVREEKIKTVLHPTHPVPPAKALALLILERHRERMKTRMKYRQEPLDDDWNKIDP